MSTTYLAQAALTQIDIAQEQIDAHVHARHGICVGCGEPAPCHVRLTASAVFARYHRLPRRRPGLALRGVVR